jgi:HD-like signal output (HDOD) protein
MVSVLFVDDNQASLQALKEAFGSCDDSWDTAFVPGGDVALHVMAERPVDAVVASAPLTGMSAASFLRLTKLKHPRTARIALSNPGDKGAMLSTLPVANQCLSKTCGTEALARVVKHTTSLQTRLFSEATQKIVAEVGALPSLPSTLAAVDAALAEEDCSLGRVAEVMSSDVAMVAKILQLVNSSFFGLRTEIRDLRQAVAYLGIEALRDFALAGSMFRAFTPSPVLPSDWLNLFNAHSLAVADTMTQLVRTSTAKCEANVAGMLHDIGELVVAERAPNKLIEIAREVSAGASRDDAEVRHMGTTYPVIGGHLLSLWGMGYNIVEAITCQRELWTGPAREYQLGDVIVVADHLVGSVTRDLRERIPATAGRGLPDRAPALPVCQAVSSADLDHDYLERVGLLANVTLYNQGFLRLR